MDAFERALWAARNRIVEAGKDHAVICEKRNRPFTEAELAARAEGHPSARLKPKAAGVSPQLQQEVALRIEVDSPVFHYRWNPDDSSLLAEKTPLKYTDHRKQSETPADFGNSWSDVRIALSLSGSDLRVLTLRLDDRHSIPLMHGRESRKGVPCEQARRLVGQESRPICAEFLLQLLNDRSKYSQCVAS
jgi:hypothetical protein